MTTAGVQVKLFNLEKSRPPFSFHHYYVKIGIQITMLSAETANFEKVKMAGNLIFYVDFNQRLTFAKFGFLRMRHSNYGYHYFELWISINSYGYSK